MHVSIADWITIITLLVAVEMAIGHGTVSLTNAVPDAWIPKVQAWCNILAFIGSTIAAALSRMVGVVLVMAVAGALALSGAARAQDRTPTPRAAPAKIGGPVGHALDVIQGGDNQQSSGGAVTVGNQKFELSDALIAKVLPDLKYATALAHQNNNVITAPCFDALLKLVDGWNAPVNGPDNQPLAMPDPHVLVTLERASELLHQLQPDSTVSVGCGALGQALQKDLATLVGTVLSGGALGLFKLPIVPLP